MTAYVDDVRAFNRFYTRQIGLLDEHFNDSPLSLPEARVLYEIDARGHATGSELASTLGIDRGYLSRILRRFSETDLVAVSPSATDRRSSTLALTAEGDVVVRRLNQKSDAAISALLLPLSEEQRLQLARAMYNIRALLGDKLPETPVVIRPYRIGELGWMIYRQGVIYNQQFGWNGEFEALIAGIYAEYVAAPESPPKNLWVAEKGGEVVGSIFVMPSEGLPGAAQLRMLYVEPAARGHGIGRLLVEQCVHFARNAGYERMRLWTHSIQQSARRLYEAARFALVSSEPHENFGQQLESEIWELRFRP